MDAGPVGSSEFFELLQLIFRRLGRVQEKRRRGKDVFLKEERKIIEQNCQELAQRAEEPCLPSAPQ